MCKVDVYFISCAIPLVAELGPCCTSLVPSKPKSSPRIHQPSPINSYARALLPPTYPLSTPHPLYLPCTYPFLTTFTTPGLSAAVNHGLQWPVRPVQHPASFSNSNEGRCWAICSSHIHQHFDRCRKCRAFCFKSRKKEKEASRRQEEAGPKAIVRCTARPYGWR